MALIDEIQAIQNDLDQQGVFFCYSGYMTEDLLLCMGGVVRKKLELIQTDRNIARTIFSVFVELSQNIIRYSGRTLTGPGNDGEESLPHGFLAIGCEDDKYFVCSSSLIEDAGITRLRGHLQHIQNLDADALKSLYKETLRGDVPVGSKGAGVGFIDMARRANGGLDFSFDKASDGYSYFCFKVMI